MTLGKGEVYLLASPTKALSLPSEVPTVDPIREIPNSIGLASSPFDPS